MRRLLLWGQVVSISTPKVNSWAIPLVSVVFLLSLVIVLGYAVRFGLSLYLRTGHVPSQVLVFDRILGGFWRNRYKESAVSG